MTTTNHDTHCDVAMISNLDSTEQLNEWKAVLEDAQRKKANDHGGVTTISDAADELIRRVNANGYAYLWRQQGPRSVAEQLIGAVPELCWHFAGILRTGYLYCPRLLLTAAELFDGIFFLAFGPKAVLHMLGQSPSDAPIITISGQEPSLQACLVRFTTRSVRTLMEHDAAQHRHESSYRHPQFNPTNDPDTITLRPLRYSVLGLDVEPDQVLRQRTCFHRRLTNELRNARDTHGSAARAIARSFAAFLSSEAHKTSMTVRNVTDPAPTRFNDGTPCSDRRWTAWDDTARDDNDGNLDFLGRRWQEWLDAERDGLVTYEQQQQPSRNNTTRPRFDTLFEALATKNLAIARHWIDTHNGDDSPAVRDEFDNSLHAIAKLHTRSEALHHIEKNATHCPCGRTHERSFGFTRQSLINWYQFVYQETMATYLDSYLIAVNMPPNSYQQIVNGHTPNAPDHGTTSSLSFSGEITRRLGEMPPAQFLGFRYRSRGTVERWRRCTPADAPSTQRSCARDISYCIQKETAQRNRSDERNAVIRSLVATVIIALISVVLDNVVFTHGFPIAGIVLIAWIIAIIPNVVDAFSWWSDDHAGAQSIVFQN